MIGCESKKSADEMMALVKFICKTANEIEEVLNETTNAIAKFDVNLRWVWICINVSPVKSFSKLKITINLIVHWHYWCNKVFDSNNILNIADDEKVE